MQYPVAQTVSQEAQNHMFKTGLRSQKKILKKKREGHHCSPSLYDYFVGNGAGPTCLLYNLNRAYLVV